MARIYLEVYNFLFWIMTLRHWVSSIFLSSSCKSAVSIGISIINLIFPLNSFSKFFDNTEREPIIAMGTTGNFDRIARINPPFLKGCISSISDRVPSGYNKVENFEFISFFQPYLQIVSPSLDFGGLSWSFQLPSLPSQI